MSTEYVRASPGGTGAAKFGGNYAASLLAQAQAAENGCDQVVWLDAVERRFVEEMGGMNLFFVFGSGGSARLVTPELSGSLLPGITRDSLLQLAIDAGFSVEERKIDIDEWQKKAAAGEITEVFACGTAAVITPCRTVKYGDSRVHRRRRRTGRSDDGAARHADRHPAGHLRRHPRLDGPAGTTAAAGLSGAEPDQRRQHHRGHRRGQFDCGTQHVAADAAESAHAMPDQGRGAAQRQQHRDRPLPRSRTRQQRSGQQHHNPGRDHRRGLAAGDPGAQRAARRPPAPTGGRPAPPRPGRRQPPPRSRPAHSAENASPCSMITNTTAATPNGPVDPSRITASARSGGP